MKALGLLGAIFLGWAASAEAGAPSFRKVFLVVFENTDYAEAMRQPFFAKLAREGASSPRFYAATHPSQGNYIAMTAGSVHGVRTDRNVDLDVSHVGDLLEAKGLGWKVYAEGYPGNCFRGAESGKYRRKHNPFISYRNVQSSPSRCARIVNADRLDADIAAGALPEYSFYVPDIDNDGHDTNAAFADRWLARTFGPRLEDRRFRDGLLFVATFDENAAWLKPNLIYTALWGDSVVPGSVPTNHGRLTHYSLLRTIEEGLGLETLGLEDAKAEPITGIWK